MYLELTDISKKLEQMRSSVELHFLWKEERFMDCKGKTVVENLCLCSDLWISTSNCGEVKIDGKILGKEFSFPQVWACLLKNQDFWILTVDFKI